MQKFYLFDVAAYDKNKSENGEIDYSTHNFSRSISPSSLNPPIRTLKLFQPFPIFLLQAVYLSVAGMISGREDGLFGGVFGVA